MKLRQFVAASSLAAVGGSVALTALASPAVADLVTYCDGVGGAVTVPGDLVVAKGKSCDLTGTTVDGNVTVRSGADLVVEDGTFKGTVAVAQDGYLDAVNTSVAGNVTARGAFGTYLDGSTLGQNVRAVAADGGIETGALFLYGSEVKGGLSAATGNLFAESTGVGGKVSADGVGFADIYDSAVDGGLTVKGAAEGSVVCASEVHGNAAYSGNSATVQIGSDGPQSSCGDTSYWGGNVAITDNTADIHVNGNIIRGDLTASGNDPVALKGADNRVRGTVGGEFGEIPAAKSRASAVKGDRSAGLKQAGEQRGEDAERAAKAAGKAF
ncbi:hypothetical protein CLV63_101242 [Murinocardiopsis flavida]|uniref:Polymer-forming protein n=1 Tax=Murinocardiopsis flavida TaxID=645275 RepID=A0A2P8DU65_9ACTN|nr:hypothetical protein [Murinocardiopsis flavida]PSL00766.1 hypothetical protein CLV63_101242 [Murinocardiopsis flavida]